MSYLPIIDFLVFSFKPQGASDEIDNLSMSELLEYCLSLLEQFGFKARLVKRPSGMYNYQESYIVERKTLGNRFDVAGIIGITRAKKSDFTQYNAGLFISLSAVGCQHVDFSAILERLEIYQPKINRIDLAVDYLDGKVGFDDMMQLYNRGAFAGARGVYPRFNTIEPKALDGEKAGGYTLYVGRRSAARFVRCYEKAYQLADCEVDNPFGHWFRVEVEARAVKCTIPLEAVNAPDAFLTGLYPHLFNGVTLPPPSHVNPQNLSQVIKLGYDSPQFVVSLSHLKKHAKASYGGLFNVLRNDLGVSDAEIVSSLVSPERVPRRLSLPIEGFV
ncbi:replication initiation factor domain-containing protein [Beggiatoa leptomitoformis]|uniref:Replication initiation protein-like C-terminal domain-containing protein n=1 Tax=Beggiatoa leptomitoformis TaxID=288004 RepID=A0A2N9YCT6_9GAMM|nr:replication initiation factor domain-containing protein [Beggiatoa leptomitoformis]ALG66444.1 hypothetical protein AL038_00185 [Beggiatoa leptomitoformis]AUI68275.1 hypothetical protein BLE401_05890 [Beggiatoa leptomitoformis]